MARSLLITLFIVTIALDIVSWFVLPEIQATHFGANGQANGWMTKNVSLIFSLCFHSFFFVLFMGIGKAVLKTPSRWVNVPNKNYWLAEENRETFIELFDNKMHQLGCAIFLFFIGMGYVIWEANMQQPSRLNEQVFMVMFVTMIAFTLWWAYRMFVDFKVPK